MARSVSTLLPTLLFLLAAAPAGAQVEKCENWTIRWSHPPSVEKDDVQMHTTQPCTLTVTNEDANHHTFDFGLEWDCTGYGPLGWEATGPLYDFFTDRTTVEFEGAEYTPGDPLIDWFAPHQTKRYVFEITYDWDWIRPWSRSRMIWAALNFLPSGETFGRLRHLANVADAFGILALLSDEFVNAPECVYELQGLLDASGGENTNMTVDAWIPREKALWLGGSVLYAVTGNLTTKLGYAAAAAGGPFGWVAAAVLFVGEAAQLASSEYFYICAYDPVDDYQTIIQPEDWERPDLSDIPPGPERLFAEAALELPALARAQKDAYACELGATKHGDAEWTARHRSGGRALAARQSELLGEMSTLSALFVDDIPQYDTAVFQYARDSLLTEGLPAIEDEILAQFGWTAADREMVAGALLKLNIKEFADCRSLVDDLALESSVLDSLLVDPERPSPVGEARVRIDPPLLFVPAGPRDVTCVTVLSDLHGVEVRRLVDLSLNGEPCTARIEPAATPIDGDDAPAYRITLDPAVAAAPWRAGERILSLSGGAVTTAGDTLRFCGAGLLRLVDEVIVPIEDPAVPDPEVPIPLRTQLTTIAPNPFNPRLEVVFTLARPGRARVDVIGLDGARIRTLLDAERGVGEQRLVWDGRDAGGREAATGQYLVVLEVDGVRDARKVTLVR